MANASSSLVVGVLFLIVVTASLTNGSSFNKDVSQRKEVKAFEQSAHLPGGVEDLATVASHVELFSDCEPPLARRRSKRCTCYTYKDKECVYYCHLDIIWINTPEHTVPFGMSSYQGSLRLRRSTRSERVRIGVEAQRCVCSIYSDVDCIRFCKISQTRPHTAVPKKDKRTATQRSGPAVK
ncbi:intersectin [Sarotherodon galilaeus]